MSEETATSAPDDIVALRRRVAELERQVDEQGQREAALQDEIWIMQSVLDAIPHAIYWKDSQLVYGGCNQRFANDMGIASTGEIVGKTDYELPWQPGEAAAFQAIDRRIMASNAPEIDIDETVVYADGSQEWFETHKAPLHGRAGQVVGVLATYTNVTRRKRAEATIQAQTVMLHELSTPVIPFSDGGAGDAADRYDRHAARPAGAGDAAVEHRRQPRARRHPRHHRRPRGRHAGGQCAAAGGAGSQPAGCAGRADRHTP
jgi:PAS domain S-box-containing protein